MGDASNNPDPKDGKCLGGHICIAAGAAVVWSCKKLRHVGKGGASHTEYMALAGATSDAVWIRNLYTDFTSDTVGATEGAGGDSGDTYSITEAVARAKAPKSSTQTYKSTKSATTLSKRGHTRTAPAKLLMQIELAQQQRLYEHLNNLFLNDINDYERTVSDVTFACDMACDYYGTVLLCGWPGDYGDSA